MIEFLNPKYLSDAFDRIDKSGNQIKICSGMTHLLRFYSNFPEEFSGKYKAIMHVGDLNALAECHEEHGNYSLGATCRISSLEKDSYLMRYAPSIVDAAKVTSTPQIRNRRSLGGEIAWGAFHSPLIVSLMALDAEIRVRFRGSPGREETMDLEKFYDGTLERKNSEGRTLINRKARSESQNLVLKLMLSERRLRRPGNFEFFRALQPKISTENSGVVVAVSGYQHNGIIQEAQMVAAGCWMWNLKTKLPLEGVRMTDVNIYEKLYAFCERYSFDKARREGPSGGQLGLIVFGLLKEGFGALLGH